MKLRIVSVTRHNEDSRKPFALRVEFPVGVVTQPVSTDEFLRALNEALGHNEVMIEVEVGT